MLLIGYTMGCLDAILSCACARAFRQPFVKPMNLAQKVSLHVALLVPFSLECTASLTCFDLPNLSPLRRRRMNLGLAALKATIFAFFVLLLDGERLTKRCDVFH
jgi:hypothetical protein